MIETIIVIEGMSAAGKTTWCTAQNYGEVVWETLPEDRHEQDANGWTTAQYWTDWNTKRWAGAMTAEGQSVLAICDTDPLKLHYCWALWRIGLGSRDQWKMQRDATRMAIENKSVGFSDYVYVKPMDPAVVRRQRDLDARVRDRFEVHLRMQDSLLSWYRTLHVLRPNRIFREHPVSLNVQELSLSKERYSVERFDRFVSLLPT